MVFTGPIFDINEIFPEEPFSDKPVIGVKVVEDCVIVATGHVDDDVKHDSAYELEESNTRPGQRLGGMELTPLRYAPSV